MCYSWWVLSSLSILGRVQWIDKEKLASFILSAQDQKDGGISDRPDNMTDVFHTYFGFSGMLCDYVMQLMIGLLRLSLTRFLPVGFFL